MQPLKEPDLVAESELSKGVMDIGVTRSPPPSNHSASLTQFENDWLPAGVSGKLIVPLFPGEAWLTLIQ